MRKLSMDARWEAAQNTMKIMGLSSPWTHAVREQTPISTPRHHSCGEGHFHLHREGTLIHARIVDQQDVVAVEILQAGDRHPDGLVCACQGGEACW